MRSVLFVTITVACLTFMPKISQPLASDATNNNVIVSMLSLLLKDTSTGDSDCLPDAVEIPGNGIDDDCNGLIDEPFLPCDNTLFLEELNPISAAASIDMCQMGLEGEKWGVIEASYKRADGSGDYAAIQHGLQQNVGAIVPRKGARMLYLSTGHARTVSQPDACNGRSCETVGEGAPPAGFPQDVLGCAGGTTIHDDIAFEIKLRAPSNVTGFQFSFFFASFEYPYWVCSAYNDQFIVQMNPAPPGAINGNVLFNSSTTPISVNAGNFDYCDPASSVDYAKGCSSECPSPPNPYCPEGSHMLNGSGYNEWIGDTGSGMYSGATGWFRTHVPVEPGTEFTLRFVIWDTGDQTVDSSAVIDNLTWLSGDVSLGTEPL